MNNHLRDGGRCERRVRYAKWPGVGPGGSGEKEGGEVQGKMQGVK